MDPQNAGSFMAPAGQPGQGSALMRLMQMRNQGGAPQAGNNVPLPASPVETGSPISMQSMQQAGQQMPQQPQPAPQPGMPQQAAPTTFDPHGQALQVAMQALTNYIQSHGKSLEANNEVPRKTAEAKVIASQAQPASAPVS